MNVVQAFEQFVSTHQMNYQYGFASDNQTQSASFAIAGSFATYQSYLYFLQEENILMAVIKLGMVPEKSLETEKKLALLTLLNQLNLTTKIGHFCFDASTGQVMVKISQAIRGTDQEQIQLVTDTILLAGVMANQSHEQLHVHLVKDVIDAVTPMAEKS